MFSTKTLGGLVAAVICLLAFNLVNADEPVAEQGIFKPLVMLPLGGDHRKWVGVHTRPGKVAFSPDGKMIAVIYGGKTVLLYHLPSGRIETAYKVKNQYLARWFCHAFSPDATLVAYGKGEAISLRSLSGNPYKSAREIAKSAMLLVLSADGTTSAVGASNGAAELRKLPEGKELHNLDSTKGMEAIDSLYDADVYSLAFTRDGKTLVAHTEFFDDELPRINLFQIWDTHSGKLKHSIKIRNVICSPVLSPDGKILVYTSEQRIELFDMDTFKVRSTLKIKNDWVARAFVPVAARAFSPDGKMLATVNLDDDSILVWDISSEKVVATLRGHRNSIWHITFSRDGTMLASSSEDGSVRIWTINEREKIE